MKKFAGRCLAAICLLSAAALAEPLAYVPNEESGTVSVIDVATDKTVGEFRAGKKPRGIAISPDGKTLYISDQTSNALLVVDTARREVVRSIALGESPEGIDLSRDGRWLAAAIEEANLVVLVETSTGVLTARIPTSGKNPEHAVFSPDGRWIYVSAEDAAQVDVIDVSARRQVESIQVGRRPRGIGFTPDGWPTLPANWRARSTRSTSPRER